MRPEAEDPRPEAARPALEPVPPQITQRRRQVAGLLLIALIILLVSIWRAGPGTMFPRGWWRLW